LFLGAALWPPPSSSATTAETSGLPSNPLNNGQGSDIADGLQSTKSATDGASMTFDNDDDDDDDDDEPMGGDEENLYVDAQLLDR